VRVALNIGNSYSRISGLNDRQFQALRTTLSYKVDFATAYYIKDPSKRIKYCIDLKGNFGTGLLERVLYFLYQNKINDFDTRDHRFDNTPALVANRSLNQFSGITPYPDQAKAIERVLDSPRGIITLPTGCGKSYVIAMLAAELQLRTLIVVPTLELKQQLISSLSDHLTTLTGIAVENVDSTNLKKLTDFDCLIIDEAHHVAAKTYHKLNKTCWDGIRYRYMFTATPFRNNTEETLLFESIAGQVIYNLTYMEAVGRGYIVPVEAFYIDVPESDVKGYTYAEVYNQLVVTNESRNLEIARILSKLYFHQKHTLCLVKEVAHGNKLVELTNLPFSHGGDAESRSYIKKFSQGVIRSLIGTTGLVGEGVDTRPCEWVVLAGMGKAKSMIMQQIGRAVRNYPGKETAKIVLFKDKSHKFMLTQYKEQCKILKEEYGVVPIKLEIE
jgi:superfamily II DNA or RNA helicase